MPGLTLSVVSKDYRQICLFYTETHHSLKARDNVHSSRQILVKQCPRSAMCTTFPELDLHSFSGDWLQLHQLVTLSLLVYVVYETLL
jgi:hypothetical protein